MKMTDVKTFAAVLLLYLNIFWLFNYFFPSSVYLRFFFSLIKAAKSDWFWNGEPVNFKNRCLVKAALSIILCRDE